MNHRHFNTEDIPSPYRRLMAKANDPNDPLHFALRRQLRIRLGIIGIFMCCYGYMYPEEFWDYTPFLRVRDIVLEKVTTLLPSFSGAKGTGEL